MSSTTANYRITETTKDIIREDMWKMMDRLVTECGVEGEGPHGLHGRDDPRRARLYW